MSVPILCPKCINREVELIKKDSNEKLATYKCNTVDCNVDLFSLRLDYTISKYSNKKDKQPEYDFETLYESIEREKCVICVGPGLYANNEKGKFESLLAQFLREQEDKLKINVYDNSWFHFKSSANQSLAYAAIRSFYQAEKKNPFAKDIFKKLSFLPFHLYLSMTPDRNLKDSFNDIPHQYAYYHKQKPSTANPYGDPPNRLNPLIYNLLGDIDENNTLVLTYDDFYLYLKSVLENKGMDNELKAEYIFNAENFIFLGVSFDMWYVHLFMRILQQHKELKRIGKVAANVFYDENIAKACHEQYTINFISENNAIEKFVNELLNHCRKKDMELLQRSETPLLRLIDASLVKKLLQEKKFTLFFAYLNFQLSKLEEAGKAHFNIIQAHESFYFQNKNRIENSKLEELLQDLTEIFRKFSYNTDDEFFKV